MPFRRRKQPRPPGKKPGILLWPGTAFFLIALLAGDDRRPTTGDVRSKASVYYSDKAAEIAQQCGATIVTPAAPRNCLFDTRFYQSTHVTGGTIMGLHPETSVVSPHLQHWDAHNLFVVGASLYLHNSGYNPSGPLAALALRPGDDLISYFDRPRML